MSDREITAYFDTFSGDAEVLQFARQQFDRGLHYYEARVDRLGLRGQHVLDAGCGVGNWSLALRKFFSRVQALELRQDRLRELADLSRHLEVGGISFSLGSVESLPFADETFDAVFSNDGISLSSYGRTLSEFRRVLKPNGMLYFSFNSTDWWKHLIQVRRTPDAIRFGCEAYLNRAFRLQSELGPSNWGYLAQCLNLELARLCRVRHGVWRDISLHNGPRVRDYFLSAYKLFRRPRETLSLRERLNTLADLWRKSSSRPFSKGWARRGVAVACAIGRVYHFRLKMDLLRLWREEVATFLKKRPDDDLEANLEEKTDPIVTGLDPALASRLYSMAEALHYVHAFGTTRQQTRLWRNLVASAALRISDYTVESQFHALQPKDMLECLAVHGFSEVGAGSEGHVIVNAAAPAASPIYERDQGVYEVLARRDQDHPWDTGWSAPDFFPKNARRAAELYGVLRGDAQVLSNNTMAGSAEALAREMVQRMTRKFPRHDFILRLVKEVTRGASSREEAFLHLYRFIQEALFHHPSVQLLQGSGVLEDDPLVILFAGIARCGHTAVVAADLFRVLGYETKVTQLHAHVCAEVFDGMRWRVVDADLFKAGVYPRDGVGQWLTLAELAADPRKLDELPCIGHILSRQGRWMRNLLDQECRGYVDAGLPWERPYASYLYFGGERQCPPEPPRLKVQRGHRLVEVVASSLSPATEQVRLLMDPEPRGWSYLDYPDQRYLKEPQGILWRQEYAAREIEKGVRVPMQETTVYVNACALDEGMLKRPQVFTWPGEEITITV